VSIQATVVIPTFDHGPLLEYSLASALAQTVSDIEIFVVGDGVPDITRSIAVNARERDARVRFFDNPKGARRGEVHRHRALAHARGEIVCYLADDDLWLPHHVETMLTVLDEHDFANALPLSVYPGHELRPGPAVDLSLPFYKEFIVTRGNRIPNSFAAHTLDVYRRLPHGWRPAPPNMHSDHYMWQQILALPDCRAASSQLPTAINFGSRPRRGMGLAERAEEMRHWLEMIRDPHWRTGFESQVLQALARRRASEWVQRQQQLDALYDSAWWRLGEAIRRPLRKFRRR
jgi:glycosyltransferase involved in cell wall biosynthesis